jgi:hypothetical protein
MICLFYLGGEHAERTDGEGVLGPEERHPLDAGLQREIVLGCRLCVHYFILNSTDTKDILVLLDSI